MKFRKRRTKQKGLISRTLELVSPLIYFLDRIGLYFIIDLVAIQFIQAYQKYLSPRKGFSCAYSRMYGSESCSEYLRRTVKTHGINKAIPLFQQRLKECELAYIHLKTLSLCNEQSSELTEYRLTNQSRLKVRWCSRLNIKPSKISKNDLS